AARPALRGAHRAAGAGGGLPALPAEGPARPLPQRGPPRRRPAALARRLLTRGGHPRLTPAAHDPATLAAAAGAGGGGGGAGRGGGADELRSEEHTSELQSLTNLVCRLLLEKKKT